MATERLDLLLCKRANYSRTFAKEQIQSCKVKVNGKVASKPGEQVDCLSEIEFEKPDQIFVSRAGAKLEKALSEFQIDASGKICLDVGSSTGGFTQCLLEHGGLKIFAVDTGSYQLAQPLRSCEKVTSMEKTNILDLKKPDLHNNITLATVDVSFVSITKILPHVTNLLDENWDIVCLIKPQFEVGRKNLNKRGIVKDSSIRYKLLTSLYIFFINNGMGIRGLTSSPIKGSDGNIEYLVHLSNYGILLEKLEFSKLCSNIFLEEAQH